MFSKTSVKIIKVLLKILLLVSVPIALSYLFIYLFPIPAFSFKRDAIVTYLSGFKSITPIIYIIFQAITVLIVPIPSVILATAAGVIFGFWQAIPYTTLAWILGTSANFYIARILGRPFLKKIMSNEELNMTDRFANNIGWKFIFFSWFIPGGTADVAGYAAGLTKMKYWKYFIPVLASSFLLSILTSAAGAAIAISPFLTALFTVGAVLGIILGVKAVVVFSLIKKFIGYMKNKFLQEKSRIK